MKRYLTNMVISAVKPKVSKTSLDKAKSKLAIAIQTPSAATGSAVDISRSKSILAP